MTAGKANVHIALLPLSCLYGLGVRLRNKLFDWRWLQSRSFPVPVICIGNLAVGGTGKTPHTEYLIRLLQGEGCQVATLSRGYKRKTKGYVLADARSDARQVGDEPFQMKTKFPDVRVAVDERRCRGIEHLLQLDAPPVDVILLDDAFQHRYVQAGLNIVLTDYHRLFCDDALLPAGRLREPASGICRSQIVVVTKCPSDLSEAACEAIVRRLRLPARLQLYFSSLGYGELMPLFPQQAEADGLKSVIQREEHVLVVTGIASPDLLMQEVETRTSHVRLLKFGDHHDFSLKDMQMIRKAFQEMGGANRRVLTTEKDAARLRNHPFLPGELKGKLYVLPIEIKILRNQQKLFNQNIIDYVKSHSRNS